MSRIVVITGASSGIGLELMKLFKENGDTVLTISRSEGDNNHYVADVAHEIKVRQVFNDIKEKYENGEISSFGNAFFSFYHSRREENQVLSSAGL